MNRIHCSYGMDTPMVWRLERDYWRQTAIGYVMVATGFVWDGASVPRRFWDLIPPWGMYSGAALIHDWLYSAKPPGVRRLQADQVFLQLMLEDGVPSEQAQLMYKAVRWFAAPAWNRSNLVMAPPQFEGLEVGMMAELDERCPKGER